MGKVEVHFGHTDGTRKGGGEMVEVGLCISPQVVSRDIQ